MPAAAEGTAAPCRNKDVLQPHQQGAEQGLEHLQTTASPFFATGLCQDALEVTRRAQRLRILPKTQCCSSQNFPSLFFSLELLWPCPSLTQSFSKPPTPASCHSAAEVFSAFLAFLPFAALSLFPGLPAKHCPAPGTCSGKPNPQELFVELWGLQGQPWSVCKGEEQKIMV